MGEYLDLLVDAIGMKSLQRLEDGSVELTTSLAEKTCVGHFVNQGVLERVLEIGEERCLIEKLSLLQVAQRPL